MPLLLALALALLAQNPLVDQQNSLRAKAGTYPLLSHKSLDNAATEQAEYLARHCSPSTLSHYVNGNPRTRALKHGYPVKDVNSIYEVQESVTCITLDPVGLIARTPLHRQTMLDSWVYTGFGVAYNKGVPYWVIMYGR